MKQNSMNGKEQTLNSIMENKEMNQDRVFDTFDHFKRWGKVLLKDNREVYDIIKEKRAEGTLLEAGCGIGTGSLIIGTDMATDKLSDNIRFARELYPTLNFDTWDIGESPYKEKYDVVVCVEAIEHVKKYREGIKNLIASARKEVWISTPCPQVPESPPTNQYHVREFTEQEFISLTDKKVEVVKPGLYRIICA